MKRFITIVKTYLVPYKVYAAINVFLNFFAAFFSLFSLMLVIPFLGILFGTQEFVTESRPFELSSETLLHNFNYYVSNIVQTQGKEIALLMVSVFVISMIFLKNFFLFFANFYMAPLRNGIIKDIRNKLYDKITRLQLSYFSNEKKGDIMARITNDVQEVEWSIMTSIEMVFREPITIFFYMVSLVYLSPELTLFVLVLLPFGGALIAYIGRSLRKNASEVRHRMGILLTIIEETLSGLRIIKAFRAERQIKDKFELENKLYTRIMIKVSRKEYLASPMSEFLAVSLLMIVMIYGGKMVLGQSEGAMKPEVFIGYIALFSQIIAPAKAFSSAFYRIQKGMAAVDRINTILDAKITITDKKDAQEITSFSEAIEFKNLNFSYNQIAVLKNINIRVEHGKTIALVGQSGSGKSTLVDLLPRFYDIQEGEIRIDGKNTKDLTIKSLRGLMGNVNQDPILFNDSIFNNIAFGVKDVVKKDIIAAAKIANAHDFIMETDEGYDTNIGDRGSKLSGGQRQRISIARAVLNDPPILILDEATSALDSESEKLVQNALTNLMKNRTSIVIAHRLSTIKHADQIYVLHEGEVVEQGKHNELIAKDGVYRKLNAFQYS